jgi:PAS domain S-box-containing protein
LLVVDDEVELMTALRDLLQQQGYDVAGATAGDEGLRALEAQDFDLLLTDLMMPGMDGIALLKAARAIDPHLIGIIMTGQGAIQTAVDAMKVGAFDYILKPFKLQAILPVLARAMGVRRLRRDNVQLRESVAIYELSLAAAFTLDADTILSKLADAARQQCAADAVAILVPAADGSELRVAAAAGSEAVKLLGTSVPLAGTALGWVAQHNEPLTLDDAQAQSAAPALMAGNGMRSAVLVPMVAGGKLSGILQVATAGRRVFTLGQIKALSILAGIAASALRNASLFGDLRAKTEQLTHSEQRFRALIENASDLVSVLDAEGVVRYASPSHERLLGYAAAELIGRRSADYEHPDDSPRLREQVTRLLGRPGETERIEYRYRHKDGSWRVFDGIATNLVDDPAVRGVVVNSRDITDRKRADEQLAFDARLLSLVSDAIVSVDIGGAAQTWNQAAERMYGWTAAEIIGRNAEDFLHTDFGPVAAADVTHQLAEVGHFRGEITQSRKDGTRIPIEVIVTALRDARPTDRLRQREPRHHRAQAGRTRDAHPCPATSGRRPTQRVGAHRTGPRYTHGGRGDYARAHLAGRIHQGA